ncbi:MAG TPA: DUF6055 domain-containing protein [Polyangiaceae bacterium]|nr:DUF6055 domain-containing protein [Polyangiaceae bacterium]
MSRSSSRAPLLSFVFLALGCGDTGSVTPAPWGGGAGGVGAAGSGGSLSTGAGFGGFSTGPAGGAGTSSSGGAGSGAQNSGGAPGPSSPSSGGTSNRGGVPSTNPGTSGSVTGGLGGNGNSSGATGLGGIAGTGGSASGGQGTAGSNAVTGGGPNGGAGTCDPGSTATQWATNCPTSPPACTAGTWIAGGPDPDHSNYKLIKESEHFAIYSDESVSDANATSALDTLESKIWSVYFGNPIYFKEPLCNQTTKYKASVHVHSTNGLTGGAWAANRMGMWIGPGALTDHWGLAHEFMHGVQSVSGGMSCGSGPNYCGWIYESHANFMPHQIAEYRGDVHCSEMSFNMPHLYLGSTRDRYCNWQFMEYLKDKYCYSAVNAIWTQSAANDPFTNIMKGMGWNISQLNDFIGEWATHNVTWDYKNPAPTLAGDTLDPGANFRSKYGLITDTSQTIRRLRTTKLDPLDANWAMTRRFASPFYWAPQRFGYNVVRLYPDAGATTVRVSFRGVTTGAPNPDWRWGLVATNSTLTTARYSALQKGADGELSFCVSPGESIWLVVAATPSVQQQIKWDQPYGTVPRYPYLVAFGNAWPDGFQDGKQAACPNGLVRVANGGGCGPANLPASVYVGPYATVLSGATVSGEARIEDHAVVARGTVSGGTVGAMTLIDNFKMSSGTAKSTFYPLGFFETGQGLSGGTLIGDVEYRGAGLSRTSGTCSGFVDDGTCIAPGADTTATPPFTWR